MSHEPESDRPVSDRARALILGSVLLALFLAALDQTIVATALPRIVEDLEGVSRYAWVASAYLLASTALVPVYGKLADTYPRKHVELGAVILFLTGSVLCGISGEFGDLPLVGDGMSQLILFRAIQGAGGAGLVAMTFIVIADLFTPAERGRYQGLVGAVWGTASVLGPLVGGLLTDHGGGLVPGIEGWRWVFYVNVPLGALALWFIARRMPRLDPHGPTRPPDLWSAALLLGCLVPFIVALQIDKRRFPWLPGLGDGAPSSGWRAWATFVLVSAAVAALAGFVSRSRRVADPIMDLRLFENKLFRRANAAGFFYGATFLSVVVFLPLFLVNVSGVSATRAGIALTPFSLGLVLGSTVSGQLVARFGRLRDIILASGVLLIATLALLARMPEDVGYVTVMAYMFLCGLGLGPSLPLFVLAVQNAVPVRHVGQATSAAQFFRQIGGTVGVAIMGTVLGTTLGGAFASLELPEAVAAEPDASPERLASTGAADLPARIRFAYEALADDVETALTGGDAEGLARLASSADLPDDAARIVRQALAEDVATLDAARARRAIDGVRASLDVESAEVTARLGRDVRGAFARATHRVYMLCVWIALVAWLLTWRMPELPLRRTHDRDEARR